MSPSEVDFSERDDSRERVRAQTRNRQGGMVGKYTDLVDAYKSLNGAEDAGFKRIRRSISNTSTRRILRHGIGVLESLDAILVPGGFGDRGIEGKIAAVTYARENKISIWHSPWLAAGDDRVCAQCLRDGGAHQPR